MNQKSIYAVVIAILLIGTALVFVENKKESESLKLNKIMEKVGYKDITSKELKSMMENKDFTLVNVHYPYIGEIENTDVFIPFDKIGENFNKLPEDKNAKIVLYCQSGGMSSVTARELADLGYTNVMNLRDGMIGWENEGYLLKK